MSDSSSNISKQNSLSGASKSRNFSEIERDLLGSVSLDNMQKLNCKEASFARNGEGTDFNILVCGAAGIGKSSFVELFIKKFNHSEAN